MAPIGPVAATIAIPVEWTEAAAAAQQDGAMSTALAQAVLQQEQVESGGGGGQGGSRQKAAIDAIARIAANVDTQPKQRVQTPGERQAEIERLNQESAYRRGEKDLADDRSRKRKPYEENPLLALF